MNDNTTRRDFLALTAGAAAAITFGVRWQAQASDAPPKGRLLHRIDCTQTLPPGQYFAHGDVKVVESAIGRYREAEGAPLSRFGYRFPLEHPGRPHLAVIRYPDDKRRYMCIMDGTTYDLTTGVFTGWAQPLSGKMLELRQVFWPRWTDASIVFTTWSEGEPAAVASVEIYELDDLPALPLPEVPRRGETRELGIQYEDPCGDGGSEGASTRQEWIDRVVQYARHTGQNLLVYPMAWYHGPQFPSQREPSDGFEWVAAPDRRLYMRWTTRPADWYAPLLEQFGREGLGFQGALTLMRLGSLLQKMNIDLEAIKAGADTFNNMLWNNHVQSSANDWTTIYNGLNFRKLTEENRDKKPLEPWNQTPSRWAYGETANPGHTGPMFNPLHPVVQEAILGLVSEIGARYAKYPAFQGISFNMFASAMPWYGSIRFGYDDYSVGLFERETGTAVPVDRKAPDRFAKRYEFLTHECRPAWVAWRCRKIRDLFGRLHRTLAAARSDLRVTVTLWDETVVTNTLGYAMERLQLYARDSMLQLYREAGIDLDLYRDQPGLEVDRGMGNSRDRGGHGAKPAGGVNVPLQDATMYRDFDFLDQEALDAFARHERPGAFIFNCWVEAWGKHLWFAPEANDPNVARLGQMDGKPAEGIFRMNSEYPEDGFWWKSQFRITPAFQGGPHFLEPYALALAEFDACRITRGGLFLDKAHGEALQAFARAFRPLPRRKFATVGSTTDPVALRTLLHDGRRYLYAVNRDYYPVKVAISLSGRAKGAVDLATGEKLNLPADWELTLGPYELRSFALPKRVEVGSFTATPPESIEQGLRQDAECALAALAKAKAAGQPIPGLAEMEQRIRAALAAKKWAWLRRALTSYTVRKCQQINS